MDWSEVGSNDQRGLVVKRGLDAERQGRPAEGSKDSDEEQERSSGRRFRFNWNSDDQSTDDSTGQSSRSHAVDLPGDSGNMTVQSPLLGTATLASRPMIRFLGHTARLARALHARANALKNLQRHSRMIVRLPCTENCVWMMSSNRRCAHSCGHWSASRSCYSFCLSSLARFMDGSIQCTTHCPAFLSKKRRRHL